MHKQPIFKKMGLFQKLKLPNSERISKKGFYIPSGLNLSDNQISFVAKKINKMVDKYS